MLFNLSRKRNFKSQYKNAIACSSKVGPFFMGASSADLGIKREPFNEENNCLSEANLVGYRIGLEGGKNMLTN
jgi:hypothetical protein